MRAFYRTLRIISSITLFFFCWTFLPLYAAVAYAAAPEGQGTAKVRSSESGVRNVTPQPADRFEKALEAIRENVGKADVKTGRGDAATEEIAAIKKQRAEIESADVEFKKEFVATEKKLKDANLPKEILDRHTKFVKHYEDNLKELKTNLAGIEQGAESKGFKEALAKAKVHLENTKAPSKHVPLDPNNLPNRMVKGKEKAPRLKKEECEKDFPSQKKATKLASLNAILTTDSHGWTRIKHKPIILADNSPASDVPLQLPRPATHNLPLPVAGEGWGEGAIPQFALSASTLNFEPGTMNLAAADIALPTAADLSETPEVQFTPEIQTLAAQLNHNPVKIYEWVRNNIEFVPTYGSIQGADMCRQTMQCNALDTNALLASLLRVSNIPVHYVYGTIEVPIATIMNWTGGFTDPKAAVTMLASGGIPVKPYASGGVITKVQMEHTWVETYIPYGNYRGAGTDDSLKTWIPMDGSFKQYTYTNGFDITATVPFDLNAYMSQVQSQNPVHYYQNQIQSYLDANMPETSIVDVKGYREIAQETYHFLPSTLPYKTIAQLGKFSAVPTAMAANVTFTFSNPATGDDVTYTASTHELAGKRITISNIPATSADEALIANYGGFLYNVPAYMLNLKPVLRVEGVIKMTGDAVTLGAEQNLTFQYSQLGGMNEAINKKLFAGAYYAVAMDLQGINENVLGKRNYQLNTNVLSETAGTLGNDDLIGEHLFILATTYHLANDKIYKAGAKLYNTVVTRTLSEGITSFTVTVSHIFGMPKSAMPSGINMDVAMDRVIAVAKDGDTNKEKAYMNISGLVSSYHEHDIFEKIDGFASVSAVRALQLASANGIPIQNINTTNIGEILPTLQVSSEIKTDIQNAVNAGREVTIPQTNVQINDWNGVGYIAKDPLTGSGTYMITGGLAGSDSTNQQDGMKVIEIFKGALGWILNQLDLLTRANIAYAATANDGELISAKAQSMVNLPYNVVDCSGLVRIAYRAAGICLDSVLSECAQNNLSDKHHVTGATGVKKFHALAKHLNILGQGIFTTNDPAIGDMIFWNNTWDKDNNCTTDEPLTHMGIVTSGPDKNGTIKYAVSSSSKNRGVVINQSMNITPAYRSIGPPYNEYLRSNSCNNYGQYAGNLFEGYGRVRPVACSDPSHN